MGALAPKVSYLRASPIHCAWWRWLLSRRRDPEKNETHLGQHLTKGPEAPLPAHLARAMWARSCCSRLSQ